MLLRVVVVVNCEKFIWIQPINEPQCMRPSLLFLLSYSIHLSNTYQTILIIILICCKLFLFDMSFRPMKLVVAQLPSECRLGNQDIYFRQTQGYCQVDWTAIQKYNTFLRHMACG